MGADLGGNPLTVVFDDFGLLLVVVLLDTVDLYRYLGIHNGVFAFVHLWQLLARDYLWRKQGKRSGHHLGEGEDSLSFLRSAEFAVRGWWDAFSTLSELVLCVILQSDALSFSSHICRFGAV